MIVAAIVVPDATFAGKSRHGLVRHAAQHRGGKHQGLEAVQGATQVATSHLGDLTQDRGARLDAEGTQSTLTIG